MSFKPNELRPEDVEDLEPWQLLVAACHFGPQMGDCIQMDYGYEVRNKVRWITDEKLGKKDTIICLAGSGEFSLEDDIEIDQPIEGLKAYAGFDWKEWAKEKILNALKEREPEDEREIT
jgi:hypothetical protein